MDQTKTTTNHEEIKAWALKHKGTPQIIDNEDALGDKIGIRIDFIGIRDEAYDIDQQSVDTDWDLFFKVFDDENLAFEYIPDFNGDPSDAYHFVKRNRVK